MTPTLYFLRSSEQNIIDRMLPHAFCLHERKKTIDEVPTLRIHSDFFGHSDKDFGLYALMNNSIAGAIWCRILKQEQNPNGFVNTETALMSIIVLEEFRSCGVASFMMEQFLQETSALYPQLSASVLSDSKLISFYEKFGFTKLEKESEKSFVDGEEVITLVKKLQKKEIQRPSDGYDSRRWME